MKFAGRLLALLLLCCASAVRATPVIVGVSDGNYDALRVENGRFVGILAEGYQCVLDQLGQEYQIIQYPQVRVLHLLERGEIDLGLPLIQVKDRDRYAQSVGRLYDVPFFLFSLDDIDPDEDLSQYSFVIRRTGASHDLLSSRRARYEQVNDWKQALDLARVGRFDGTVIPAQIARSFSAEDFGDLKKSLFGNMQLSIYVSRKSARHQQLVDTLNRLSEQCQK